MAKYKLTPAKKRLLEALAAGHQIVSQSGSSLFGVSAHTIHDKHLGFWSRPIFQVKREMVFTLKDEGLIDFITSDSWVLTPLGRKVIGQDEIK